MPVADDIPDGSVDDAADQLKHDLKTPLTTIYSRAYLLGRAARRAPSLPDEERGKSWMALPPSRRWCGP